MKKYLVMICLSFFVASSLYSFTRSPDDLISKYYYSQKFQRETVIISLFFGGFEYGLTKFGKKSVREYLMDYTIVEMKIKRNRVAYAHIKVKTRSVYDGIKTLDKYWRMVKIEGDWKIDNIVTLNRSQQNWYIPKGVSLDKQIESIWRRFNLY